MLSKSFRLIQIKLQVNNNVHFNFPFPIPFYIFQELLDCFLELIIFVCLFIPKPANPGLSSSFSVYAAKELVQMVIQIFDSITECEPFDLVDVSADHVRVSIKVR